MRRDHAVEVAWAAWLAGTVGSFAVLESLALRTHRLPTLSATLRRWLGVEPRSPWGRVSPVAFLAFWTWLTVHLARSTGEVGSP